MQYYFSMLMFYMFNGFIYLFAMLMSFLLDEIYVRLCREHVKESELGSV